MTPFSKWKVRYTSPVGGDPGTSSTSGPWKLTDDIKLSTKYDPLAQKQPAIFSPVDAPDIACSES